MILHGVYNSELILNSAIISGLILGFSHVFAGPDHLAAITPLAIENRLKAWLIGLFWGIGHTIGLLFLGAIFIFLKETVSLNIISEYGSKVIGIVIIFIGIWSIYKIKFNNKSEGNHILNVKTNKQNIITSFFIGIIHGISGVAHIMALSISLGFSETKESIYYAFSFCLSSVFAMIIYVLMLGYFSHKFSLNSNSNLYKNIKFITAILVIVIGIIWTFNTPYH